jgi:hypothetical protein
MGREPMIKSTTKSRRRHVSALVLLCCNRGGGMVGVMCAVSPSRLCLLSKDTCREVGVGWIGGSAAVLCKYGLF